MAYRRWSVLGVKDSRDRMNKYSRSRKRRRFGLVLGEYDWRQMGRYRGYTSDNKKKEKSSQKAKGRYAIVFLIAAMLLFGRIGVAHADSFYPSGDTAYCQFAQGISLSYSSLPIAGTGPGEMYYDLGLVRGEGDGFPGSHNIFDIAEVRYPNARRYNGVADYIAVPPNTIADFGLFVFNFAGHDVSLRESQLFVSRQNPSDGDLMRLGAFGIPQSLSFLYFGTDVVREGYAVRVPPIGTWGQSSWEDPPLGVTIARFKTLQPIQITARNVRTTFGGDGRLHLLILTTVANTSTYSLDNVHIEETLPNGEIWSQVFDFEPHGAKYLRYGVDMGLSYALDFDVGPIIATDPNSHTESIGIGSGSVHTYDPENRVFMGLRDDLPAVGWYDYQPDMPPVPEGDFLTVELLPYEVRSEITEVSVQPELQVLKLVSDSDEELVEHSESQPGEEITYTINVSNTGARARNIEIIDSYDTNYLELVDSGVFEAIGQGVLRHNISEIHANQEESYELKFKIRENLQPGEYSVENLVRLECLGGYCDDLEDSTTSNVSAYVDFDLEKLVWDGGDWSKIAEFSHNIDDSDIESLLFKIDITNTGNVPSRPIDLLDLITCDPEISVKQVNSQWEMTELGYRNVTNSILPGDTVLLQLEIEILSELEVGEYQCVNNVVIEGTELESQADVILKIWDQNGENEDSDEDDPDREQDQSLAKTGGNMSLIVFFLPLFLLFLLQNSKFPAIIFL